MYKALKDNLGKAMVMVSSITMDSLSKCKFGHQAQQLESEG